MSGGETMRKRVLVKMQFEGMMVKEFYLYSGGDDEEEALRNLLESAKELREAFKPDAIIVSDPETDITLLEGFDRETSEINR